MSEPIEFTDDETDDVTEFDATRLDEAGAVPGNILDQPDDDDQVPGADEDEIQDPDADEEEVDL